MSAPQRSSLHLTGALWSHEAVQAGRTIKWLVVAYEAGRDHRLAWATGVKTEAGDSARPIGVSGASVAAAEAQRQGAGRECSPPSLDRARLFPVRPNVDRAATHPALVAHDLGPERRDRRVARTCDVMIGNISSDRRALLPRTVLGCPPTKAHRLESGIEPILCHRHQVSPRCNQGGTRSEADYDKRDGWQRNSLLHGCCAVSRRGPTHSPQTMASDYSRRETIDFIQRSSWPWPQNAPRAGCGRLASSLPVRCNRGRRYRHAEIDRPGVGLAAGKESDAPPCHQAAVA